MNHGEYRRVLERIDALMGAEKDTPEGDELRQLALLAFDHEIGMLTPSRISDRSYRYWMRDAFIRRSRISLRKFPRMSLEREGRRNLKRFTPPLRGPR